MKAISAVIATILMLMITIAITGTAYLYVSGVFGSRTSVLLAIDQRSSCRGNNLFVYVRNDGSNVAGNTSIDITYPNGTIFNSQCFIDQISAGNSNSATCPISSPLLSGFYQVKASSTGSSATGTIYCSPGSTEGGAPPATTSTTTTTSSAPVTDTVGSTSGTNGWNGYIVMTKINASASGTLQTIGVNLQSICTGIEVGIYNDNSGTPNLLLGNSSNIAPTTGWNDVSISGGISITSGNYYYLALEENGGCTNYQNVFPDSGTNPIFYVSQTYGTWNNWSGGSGPVSEAQNMRMTYQ